MSTVRSSGTQYSVVSRDRTSSRNGSLVRVKAMTCSSQTPRLLPLTVSGLHFARRCQSIISSESYVKTIVERYKNSPNIFAWELMNEARCLSDTLPAGPNCVPGSNTLLKWYEQQSDFVRSL